METLTFKNRIAGKDVGLGKAFIVQSEFYNDFHTEVADSTAFDIKMAISRAKGAITECNSLSFDEKKSILERAAKKINFNNDDYEYVVKYTGMPIRQVKKQVEEIKTTLSLVPQLIEKRIGTRNGKIGRKPVNGEDFFKFLHPINGTVYSVTPANDPRVTAFVAAWVATLGIPTIFKVASTDVLISQKIIKAIVDAGYPDAGLNQVCWNTKDPRKRALNFDIIDSSRGVWVFGNDETVDKLLRFEETQSGNVDHFSDKIVLRHASGRSAGIYDGISDTKTAAKIITESALDWPIACNAMKVIFEAENNQELLAEIEKRFEEYARYTGDPLKEDTRVGYTSAQKNSQVYERINSLKKLGIIEQLQGKKNSEKQTTPILVKIEDEHSEFLSKEYSTYLLAIKTAANFDEAIRQANYSAGQQNRLAVSVFSDDEEKILSSMVKAHHVKRHRHSTELDILFHEGNDYLYKLTTPQIHRVSF